MPLLTTARKILGHFNRASWDELKTRGAQECWKRLDWVAYPLGWTPAEVRLDGRPRTPGRFFFTPAEVPEIARLLRERLPGEAGRILAQAERICRHEFDLLGYRGLDYGAEIDWHLDAAHARRAPRKAWYRIRYLDFHQVGDHKVIWELNRHQHLVTLAKAYRLTGEERFAAELFGQWRHWLRRNRYPFGINWASSLEVALRSLSWIWMKQLLAGSPAVPRDFEPAWRRALALSGRHIERYLSTYFSPNTHLLGEAVGLFFIGTVDPSLPTARRWRNLGWRVMLREAGRQVRRDGLHFEQSLYYHVYALDLFLHARLLAAANGIAIPPIFDDRLLAMLEVLLALAYGGPPPRFGDDDGGRLFDPQRNRAEHLLDPLATGAVLFRRADFKAAAGGWREESLWLLGPEGLKAFDDLETRELCAQSRGFSQSGLYVLAGSKPLPRRLVIQAGSATSSTRGHAHADALSVHLVVNGREWLADPGTYGYVSATGREREAFRGTGAHSTLRVDRWSQGERAGPFGWRTMPEPRAEMWVAGKSFDLFAGSHDGYRRLPDPVLHRRWVFREPCGRWWVRDVAEGKGLHQLELRWHLGLGLRLRKCGGRATVAWPEDSSEPHGGLVFLPVEGHGWVEHIEEGEVSPVYGVAESAPVLTYRLQVTVPAEFTVILMPVRQVSKDCDETWGNLTRIRADAANPAAAGFRYTDRQSQCVVAFARPGKPWKLGPWESDAAFAYMAACATSAHLILCHGSYLALEAHPFVAADRSLERFEWSLDGRGEFRACSDEAARPQLDRSRLMKLRDSLQW